MIIINLTLKTWSLEVFLNFKQFIYLYFFNFQGLKTRFKYVNVNSEDYGLNDETLIYADDKLLNQLVGIKKLAPYRED